MTARTSVAGSIIVVSRSRPSSRSSCHADVSGRMQASTAVWIFVSSASRSLGNFLPRKSDMYLSTLGARVASTSGLGCSLNRASLSSLVRQCLRCLLRYFSIAFGTLSAPSLVCTMEAGSKSVRPLELSESPLSPSLGFLPLLAELVLSLRFLPPPPAELMCPSLEPTSRGENAI